jgi:hypothetical protein
MQDEITGPHVILETCLRILQTPQGSLIGDPFSGYDLVGEIDSDVTPQDGPTIASRIDAALKRDRRIASSTSTCTLMSDATGGNTLVVQTQIVTSAGPFDLVFTLTAGLLSGKILTPGATHL